MVLKSFMALNRLNCCLSAFYSEPLLLNKFNTYGNLPKCQDVGTTQERAPECGVILGSAQEFTENIRLNFCGWLPRRSYVFFRYPETTQKMAFGRAW